MCIRPNIEVLNQLVLIEIVILKVFDPFRILPELPDKTTKSGILDPRPILRFRSHLPLATGSGIRPGTVWSGWRPAAIG